MEEDQGDEDWKTIMPEVSGYKEDCPLTLFQAFRPV